MADNVNELASQVYGDSWGTFLEKSLTDSDNEQPIEESETESEEVEEQSESEETETEETDDEQPEKDSEEETEQVDDDPEISLGEGKSSVKLSELKSGYMRQSDYTKKTNELAAQRKELESDRERLKNAQSFHDHMEANPWLWEQVNSALQQFDETDVLPIDEVLQDAQYGKYINHLMAENNTLRKELDGIKGEYERTKLSNAMQSLQSDLKAEYGDLVTDEYMSKLQERAKSMSIDDLRDIADGQLAKQALQSTKKEVKSATKKAEAKAIQKLAETKNVAPNVQRSTSTAPSKGGKDIGAGRSWGEWMRDNFN